MVSAFSVTPTNLDFGSIFVGATASIDVIVTNISGATQSPNFAGGAPFDPNNFGGSQDCAGVTFAPGDHCTLSYEFNPTSSGLKTSSTTFDIDDENFAISMTGVGLFPFTVAPTSLDFGSVAVGATATLDVVITNISGVSQSPNFAGGAPLDPTDFGGSQDCGGFTFAPGDHCTFSYEFHPTSVGTKTTNTAFDIDDENFPISMTGVGGESLPTTAPPSSTAPVAGTGLPTTGSPVQTLITAGAILIVAGIGVLAIAWLRRRRTA